MSMPPSSNNTDDCGWRFVGRDQRTWNRQEAVAALSIMFQFARCALGEDVGRV